MPNELANPVAVLMSDDGRNLTVITTLQDPSGNPVISAIHLNKQKGKYVINELATTFGRERFNTWVSKRYDKFLYINKNKSPANSTLPHFLGQSKTAHMGVVDSKTSKQNILIPSDVVNKFETGGKFSQSSTVGNSSRRAHCNAPLLTDKSAVAIEGFAYFENGGMHSALRLLRLLYWVRLG